MKSIYNLSEKKALKNFSYDRKYYKGIIFDREKSVFNYILSLIFFVLLFGGGFQVFSLFGYLATKDSSRFKGHELFNLENPYTKFLVSSRLWIFLFIVLISFIMLFSFMRYRREKAYKFKSIVSECMVAIMVLALVLSVILSISMNIRIGKYSELYYLVVLALILIKFIVSIKRYRDKLYNDELGANNDDWISLFSLIIAIYPIYLTFKSIANVFFINAHTNFKNVIYGILAILFLLLPYYMIFKADRIVNFIMRFHLRDYYILKYPESYRKQANMSVNEFYYGNESHIDETIKD